MSAASDLADAIYRCMEVRKDELAARESAAVPDSWDYFGAPYFDAIDRADEALAVALRAALDGTP